MEVIILPEAEERLEQIEAHILKIWGVKSRNDFKLKIFEKSTQIAISPESCPELEDYSKVFKALLTKQTTLFYTVDYYTQKLKIISVFDTRQDPDNLNTEID